MIIGFRNGTMRIYFQTSKARSPPSPLLLLPFPTLPLELLPVSVASAQLHWKTFELTSESAKRCADIYRQFDIPTRFTFSNIDEHVEEARANFVQSEISMQIRFARSANTRRQVAACPSPAAIVLQLTNHS